MTGGGYQTDLMTVTSTTDSENSGPENEERGNWRNKFEFVFASLSYVVGLGNIWRFPYLVNKNGGGAFFIPYIVMVVFCGLPVIYMEMALGQYASLGPTTIWRAVPLFKGVGYCIFCCMAIFNTYYMLVNSWSFYYLFASFSPTGVLPWSTCDNIWNSDACSLNKFQVSNCSLVNTTFLQLPEMDKDMNMDNSSCISYLLDCISSQNQSEYPRENVTECINWLRVREGEDIFLPERLEILATLKSPSEEFFNNRVLNKSERLEDMGSIQWGIVLFLLINWILVGVCLVKGIYTIGKVAYFVFIIPVILLLVLLMYGYLYEGHLEGIRFYLSPNWMKVLDPKVWNDAATQAFLSMSAMSGGLVTMASYNKFNNNIYRDAILICLGDFLVSTLSGLVVFASMGILANQLNTTIDNVVESSTGLVFVAFPAAVINFQPASMWASLFFLMILMMGLSTSLVNNEFIITVIIDENVQMLRKKRIYVVLGVCVSTFLVSLFLTTRSGAWIVELLDTYIWQPVILCGIFHCVVISWVYKASQFCKDIRMMTRRPVSYWWRAMWSVVTPLIIIFVLVSSLIAGVNLDPDIFPDWSRAIGIILATLLCLCIPGYAAKKIYYLEGTFVQRVKEACVPDSLWGPALEEHWKPKEYYPAVNTYTLSAENSIEVPVPAISDRVEFGTSKVQLRTKSNQAQSRYVPKADDLPQKPILKHVYSNPQCSTSQESIHQTVTPRLSLVEELSEPSDKSQQPLSQPSDSSSPPTDTSPQPSDKPLQPSDKLLQSSNKSLQFSKKLPQSSNVINSRNIPNIPRQDTSTQPPNIIKSSETTNIASQDTSEQADTRTSTMAVLQENANDMTLKCDISEANGKDNGVNRNVEETPF